MRDVESTATEERLAQRLSCGPHRLIADEPPADGGNDEGPAPTEYLSIALAGCTTMTIKLYADRHQWPLSGVHVTVSQSKQPEGRTFARTLTLEGALSEEQRARLLEVAKRCPVSRILEDHSVMVIRLAVPA
jgi:putative redox protein